MKRLLITGGSGNLGHVFTEKLSGQYQVLSTFHKTIVPYHKATFAKMDITDYRDVGAIFREFKPEIVIHTAALANVDECEKNPHDAWQINEAGTENVSIFCRELKSKLVYISTDSIYDGSTGIHKENEKPNPINIYAKTKLIGEQKALIAKNSLIIRTAYFDRLADWALSELKQDKKVQMFTDTYFSPLCAEDLVITTNMMLLGNLSGIYNVGSFDFMSKYEFGRLLAHAFKYDQDWVIPVVASSMGNRVPRPKDLSLNIGKAEQSIGTPMPSILEGIARYQDELKTW